MKLMHLADLHIGKRIKNYSMLEDQKFILDKILAILEEESIDAVLIAGDVYDKATPSGEAVALFDAFLTEICRRGKKAFIIAGNHDSVERLSFGSELMRYAGIHIAKAYSKDLRPWTLEDEHGAVDIWPIPYVRWSDVRREWPDEDIQNDTDAMRAVVSHLSLTPGRRNVAIVHQYIADSQKCDSEDLVIGGLENIDAAVFDAFDYVALGHLHGPQEIGRETVRYAGSPLKYSFSELHHAKSIPIVEIADDVSVQCIPLTPMREWISLRGSFEELISQEWRDKYAQNYYSEIILTDENRVSEARQILKFHYPYMMEFRYENSYSDEDIEMVSPEVHKTPMDYIADLYTMNNCEMTEEDAEVVREFIQEIWGEVEE